MMRNAVPSRENFLHSLWDVRAERTLPQTVLMRCMIRAEVRFRRAKQRLQQRSWSDTGESASGQLVAGTAGAVLLGKISKLLETAVFVDDVCITL